MAEAALVFCVQVLGAILALQFLLNGLLSLFGFTGRGVAAGSPAASWQSIIGLVCAGSLFAWLQSLGAVGGITIISWPFSIIFGAVALVAKIFV